MKRTIAILALALFANCSIYQKDLFLAEPYQSSSFQMPLKVTQIEVVDSRRKVDTREMVIPFMSFPGNKDEIIPEMTSEQKELLIKQAEKYFHPNGRGSNIRVKIELVSGVKRFSATWFYEQEYVRTVVKVTMFDDLHDPFLFSSSGDAYYEVKSVDASKEYLEKLYKKALSAALYKAMEAINNGINSEQSNQNNNEI